MTKTKIRNGKREKIKMKYVTGTYHCLVCKKDFSGQVPEGCSSASAMCPVCAAEYVGDGFTRMMRLHQELTKLVSEVKNELCRC